MLDTPLVVANWKMHKTASQAMAWVNEFSAVLESYSSFYQKSVVVAPPFTSLQTLSELGFSYFRLAAQNCSWETQGALTGEISPLFLKDWGCEFVILGHSERRQFFGEDNEMIKKKVQTVLKVGMTPILCIGESLQQRSRGQTFEVLEEQLSVCLGSISNSDLSNLVIAYEPLWAIGTGQTARLEQIEEVHRELIAMLMKKNPDIHRFPRLIYGGSVNLQNVKQILQTPFVDGVLVGSASLNAIDFAKMLREGISSTIN